MKTRSTKPKSKRNTKYNRKTHRKQKKSLHKKRRSRGRKYGGDSQLSAIGNVKNIFGMASCGDKTDNFEKIVCEIGKIDQNIKKLYKDDQFMKFEDEYYKNALNKEIDGPSRKLYKETLDKITKLNNYIVKYRVETYNYKKDVRIGNTTLDKLHETFNGLVENAHEKSYMNIPMYDFITEIMPIMDTITAKPTTLPFGTPVGDLHLYS